MNEETTTESQLEDNQEQGNWRFPLIVAGLVFIINGFLADLFIDSGVAGDGGGGGGSTVGDLSAMLGAIILAMPILWKAFQELYAGKLTTNELVAIAVSAAFATGRYHEAGLVAFFMLLAEMIETRTAEGAKASIESLIKLTPSKARRITANSDDDEEVAAANLAVGDIIRVRPGDNIPADGEIVKGSGSINEANITGESLPRDKSEGDEVFEATTNITGVLEVRVTKAGQETTFGRVRELILAAEKTKLPIMKIVDQYMVFYTPLVLVMGALVWALTNDLNRVIAVYIVACPVAFILATPTAIVASLSAAARLGVLIKQVSDIELAARINAFVFDKTGTVTTGKLAVSRMKPVEGSESADLLLAAASAERYSNHPTAKAMATLASEVDLDLVEPEDFTETAGKGVSARINGATVLVGRQAWMEENNVDGDFEGSVDLDETQGYSLVFVASEGKYIGWIGMSDQTREEAAEAMASLKEEGVRRVSLVSGDRTPVAERVSAEIGCDDVSAECLPGDKVDYVKNTRSKGYKVAVVGDGVNDAPALAAGDIGIAMGAAGSEVAIKSATIALMNNDLRRLPFLVRLSRMTRAVINQNFLFGIFFVIGGLVLAWMGYITAVMAAALHVVGSLFVVFNSARLVRQGEELEPFEAPGQSTDDQGGEVGDPTPAEA
ncbi:MAG: cation-translocating P-type ATPase [Verrucomicrobiota bacterium]|nr:cation-translocating P-type ATPase [Verrucomicrobiota bacterium]